MVPAGAEHGLMLLHLPSATGDAATNMAVDAVLLEDIPRSTACFRHYAWSEPAVTFGYAQAFAGVKALFPSGLRLCRRPTGGGIVDHRKDWTYSFIAGAGLPACRLPAARFYTLIHEALSAALSDLGVDSRLAPCPRHCDESPETGGGPAQCFLEPVADDLLRPDGKKIAGAAMKRNRHGLLLQGSVDRTALPGNLDYAAFEAAALGRIAETLGLVRGESGPATALPAPARIAAEVQRFSSTAWTQKR